MSQKAKAAQGVIEGFASTWGGLPDAYGDLVERGAFAATLARHHEERSAPAMLWAHDPARIVGSWVHLAETPDGLQVKGPPNLNTTAGRDAFEHVKAGDLSGGSALASRRGRPGARRRAGSSPRSTSTRSAPRRLPGEPPRPHQGGETGRLPGRLARPGLLDAGLPRGAAESATCHRRLAGALYPRNPSRRADPPNPGARGAVQRKKMTMEPMDDLRAAVTELKGVPARSLS